MARRKRRERRSGVHAPGVHLRPTLNISSRSALFNYVTANTIFPAVGSCSLGRCAERLCIRKRYAGSFETRVDPSAVVRAAFILPRFSRSSGLNDSFG